MLESCGSNILCGISSRFQLLSPSERQVTHALLTRPPLSLPSLPPKIPLGSFVRLACVRHAASVRPEPGSNSLKSCIISSDDAITFFRAFFSLIFTSLTCLFLFLPLSSSFRNYCLKSTFYSSWISGSFSFRCLIFKVLRSSLEVSLCIISLWSYFVKLFSKLFSKSFPSMISLFLRSLPVSGAKQCHYTIILPPFCQSFFTFFFSFFSSFYTLSRVFLRRFLALPLYVVSSLFIV